MRDQQGWHATAGPVSVARSILAQSLQWLVASSVRCKQCRLLLAYTWQRNALTLCARFHGTVIGRWEAVGTKIQL